MNEKRRSPSQIEETESLRILETQFPSEWVSRKYNPDYGIDLSIELFEKNKANFVTTGEHLYFQVKGTRHIKPVKYKVYGRDNVEKSLKKDKKCAVIDVVKHVIDTSLLSTVEKMGSAVPVILALVDITSKNTYFLCLNDYIEKFIIPKQPDYHSKKSLTLYIPIANLLNSEQGLISIRWYAKRAKLFALFSKIVYQKHEIEYVSDSEAELIEMAQHFLYILSRSDAWNASTYFGIMSEVKLEMDYFIKNGITPSKEHLIESFKKNGTDVSYKKYSMPRSNEDHSLEECERMNGVCELWAHLHLMEIIFEDVAKEYNLPTFLGLNSGL